MDIVVIILSCSIDIVLRLPPHLIDIVWAGNLHAPYHEDTFTENFKTRIYEKEG